MSRLVGRDGYLLPFATNAFHLHKVAQLHHLHHQDVGINEHLTDSLKPNENCFFRYLARDRLDCSPSLNHPGSLQNCSLIARPPLSFIAEPDLQGSVQVGSREADILVKETPNKLCWICKQESRHGPEASEQSLPSKQLRTRRSSRYPRSASDPQGCTKILKRSRSLWVKRGVDMKKQTSTVLQREW